MAFTLSNNEFLANLTNLALQVLTFDQVTFKQPFAVFKRQYTKWGDKIACVTAFAPAGQNYSSSANPFENHLPDVREVTIKTKLKRTYPLTLSNEILRGAFEDDNSLGVYLNTLLAQLVTFSEIDIYEQIITDFATLFTTAKPDTVLAPTVSKYMGIIKTGVLDSNTAVERYREILKTAREMKLPNQKYGLVGDGEAQKIASAMGQDLVLILTPEASALFDTYVNASLFNSKEIELSKSIKNVIVSDIDDLTSAPSGAPGTISTSGTFAILCTEDVYRYSPRIESMEVNRNGATMGQHYFYHIWTNMGFTGAGQIAYFSEN
ncbi:MAG: hypothetical protein J6Q87_03960 [Clostridia bacterium]|nr:hypothetical protein [Clostridia bacterium]